jgi:hypothetical protein
VTIQENDVRKEFMIKISRPEGFENHGFLSSRHFSYIINLFNGKKQVIVGSMFPALVSRAT